MPWYIEEWAKDAAKAEWHKTVPTFTEAQSLIEATLGERPDAIMRILGPNDATKEEIEKLRAMGAQPL